MLQPIAYLFAYLNADRSEKGATATEYALIIAGIALVVFVAIQTFGDTLNGLWGDINTAVEGTGA